jgi:hypothetical protein
MEDVFRHFPTNYNESRVKFRKSLADINKRWPEGRSYNHPLGQAGLEDLTIDWIQAPANDRKKRLLIISTGEHGIEGLIGSAALSVFCEEFQPSLDPADTGLLYMHAINPWGMQHLRRANAYNIDLNRNFLWDPNFFEAKGQDYNAGYARIYNYLNPRGKIKGSLAFTIKKITFLLQTMWNLLAHGQEATFTAVVLGQYRFSRGIYYGGHEWAEETRLVMNLYRQTIAEYDQIVHLDMHSGYGPRYQMSIVNSYLEPQSSQEMQFNFTYPLVVKSNPSEFYSMQGDMIDYLYSLIQNEFPKKHYYGASFEFGTFGDTALARLRSLRTMVFENQSYHFGTVDAQTARQIDDEFLELYYPRAQDWREKALFDARQAFDGILKAYRYI